MITQYLYSSYLPCIVHLYLTWGATPLNHKLPYLQKMLALDTVRYVFCSVAEMCHAYVGIVTLNSFLSLFQFFKIFYILSYSYAAPMGGGVKPSQRNPAGLPQHSQYHLIAFLSFLLIQRLITTPHVSTFNTSYPTSWPLRTPFNKLPYFEPYWLYFELETIGNRSVIDWPSDGPHSCDVW